MGVGPHLCGGVLRGMGGVGDGGVLGGRLCHGLAGPEQPGVLVPAELGGQCGDDLGHDHWWKSIIATWTVGVFVPAELGAKRT